MVPMNDAVETSETRVAVGTVPESHKNYIRSVFRKALPETVTDAQVDDAVRGYLVEYVHHIGIGYITEDYHKHGLCNSVYWPGPQEEYALKAREYFTDNLWSFINTKNFYYLGMALHPIYDVYDEYIANSCTIAAPGSSILTNYVEWFNKSDLNTGRLVGYGLVMSRTSAIKFIYGKIKPTSIASIDGPRIFNEWMTNLFERPITYEPCVPEGYL